MATIQVGNGIYQDYVCYAYVLCNGSPAQCTRMNGTSLNFYELLIASVCDSVRGSGVDVQESLDGGNSWSNVATGGRVGGAGYAYIGWTIYTSSSAKIWRAYDHAYGYSSWVYINYYTLTIHVQDLLGTGLFSGVHVYLDDVWIGAPDGYGNITKLVTGGNHTVKVTRDPTCSGWDTWGTMECSYTVNVTGDQTQNVTLAIINDCVSIHTQLYGAGGTPVGIFSTCWRTDATHYMAISVKDIPQDENPKYADICVIRPWDSFGDCNECTGSCPQPRIYENSWSPTYTNGDQVFKFKIGDIWNSGATRWLYLEQVCYINRTNQGAPDKSAVYVDCANGNDNNTGLCGFDYALATITKAQTIVANNGTIYIKYGNCTNETLNAVLNPIQNNVRLMPVQDEVTEGHGQVYINGT